MVSDKIRMLGVPLLIVLDESGAEYEHESGATLSFNNREVQSYSLEWNGRRELVLMLKSIDDFDSLIKGVWECFFKALGITGGTENFSTLSKDIYTESFLDHFHEVETVVNRLWELDNHEFFEEPDEFMDHDDFEF